MLSEDIKMYMYLPNAKGYCALNDRTISLLMKGNVDMSATTDPSGPAHSEDGFSDDEVREIAKTEQEIKLFTVYKNKTRAGGSFFQYLNITIFDLTKSGIFKIIDRKNYKHNCLYLALKAGGLSDVKLQELILTLRNRHIHKCDLFNLCNTLEIHIELIPLGNDGETNRVEHDGKEFDEKYLKDIWVWFWTLFHK